MSTLDARPRPSHCGHMPPVIAISRCSVAPSPFSSVISPLIEPAGMLKLNALAGPILGSPRRLKMTRSIAWASVTVPTVERALAPMRSWSTMIAGVRFSRDSTSGRGGVAMKPWRNAEYVSLMSRCDSAAIVSNTSELLPEPDTPVKTVSCRFGMSRLTSRRLFSRAPRTWIVPQSVMDRSCRICRWTAGAVDSHRYSGGQSAGDLLARLLHAVQPGEGLANDGLQHGGLGARAHPRGQTAADPSRMEAQQPPQDAADHDR